MFATLYAQVREEVQVISLQFTSGNQDLPRSGKKKRKQLHDEAAIAMQDVTHPSGS